jgi:TolB-like protein/Tfp pilus assembly protein PilF
MNGDPNRLIALAQAVADGRQLDWREVESGPTTDDERELLRELRLLAGVAEAHRAAEADSDNSATTGTSPATPRRWGPLEIRDRIGAGAFGAVYRAWDPRLAREVALKLLHQDTVTDRLVPSVIEEGRLLARVRHPHIITVFGADRFDGQVGIWMELIRGRTIEEAIRLDGPLSAREAASLGADLCASLAAVHGVGLVHRDVKATNVMREEGGRIVLMDFGAGQDAEPVAAPSMTGTPCYMAPELFDGSAATPRSDLYSLGVLLFRVVTREYPVPGRTTAEIRVAHRRGERRQLIDVRPDLPAPFVQVVERALARDAAERYETAGAMAAALAQAFEVSEPEAAGRAPVRSAARISRRALLAAGLLATLAVAGVLGRGWIARVLAPPVHTVVVLPLTNVSGDPAQAYFAEGVTEILMGRLDMLGPLRVVSRASIAALPADQRDPASLRRRLGAAYVVEGSVHRERDRVRVVARLADAASGALLLSRTFERPLGDQFALQGEVAAAIGAEVGARLSGPAAQRLLSGQTHSTEAQDLYLQARYLIYTFSRSNFPEARRLLERAVAIDPDYAVAHASLARTYGMLLEFDMAAARDVQTLAVMSARRGVELSADVPETHVAYADTKYRFDHDWLGAESAYRRALELAPHASIVRTPFSKFLAAAGRLDEALAHAEAGERADPLSAEMIASVGIIHYYRRDWPQARAAFERAGLADPSYGPASFGMARVLSAEGRYGEAIDHIRHAMSLTRENATYLAELARNYFLGGWRNSGEQVLGRLLADARAGAGGVNFEAIGYVYAALGDLDRAFEWLHRSFDHYHARLLFVNVDPRADPLRADPRFAALVQRLGLTP